MSVIYSTKPIKVVPKTSAVSLTDVIKNITGKDVPFSQLDYYTQDCIARYIKKHHLKFRTFGSKWYDVLTNKFFALEYPLDNEITKEEKREFDSFKEFFEYVQGDIYKEACFFGYTFSEEEIRDYSIDVELLNCNAFIERTIDSYTFESIKGEKAISDSLAERRANDIKTWFEWSRPITKAKQLESEYKKFTTKFDFYSAKDVFFSWFLRHGGNSIEKAAIQFACRHEAYDGLSFEKIMLMYGKDAALRVIEDYEGDSCSESTRKRRIRAFKDILAKYESGQLILKRRLCFDEALQMYHVRDSYCENGCQIIKNEEYFLHFDEFVSYVMGDLSDADLAKAPLNREDIKKYKTNENTKLPLSEQYESYKVKKEYKSGAFFVTQKWIDGQGAVILEKMHSFSFFFDFVHFLKGDLSNADLLSCEGIENLHGVKNLIMDGAKVRSEAAKKLGLPLRTIPEGFLNVHESSIVKKNEIATLDNYLIERPLDDDYGGSVSYITDIHLLHRFEEYKCKTLDDCNYVIRKIADTLGSQATAVNLIGGDTSSNFGVFKSFVSRLSSYSKGRHFFFVLGNHELWGQTGETFVSIIEKYREILQEIGQGKMHLVQNNLFYAEVNTDWKEIPEEELYYMSADALREKTRAAKVIIFGGIGFAGMNYEFNANDGIYEDILDRDAELKESNRFVTLYEKVTEALRGRNLIVLTHMPMKDWGGEDMAEKEGVVYVSGHDHRNDYYDDGKKRIFADNQVGYKGKAVSFKTIPFDFCYDWFADYKDGIYEISKDDYEKFYRGIGEPLTFNREYEKLFMIKREETYMFFMRTVKGSTLILNGGSIKSVGNHPLEYFYENLHMYSTSVKMFLSDYDEFQKTVSKEVKLFGGDGWIHGSIVDIDFYNHLFLNPLDGTVTPYFAYSMVDKEAYFNLPSLLNHRCPKLFENYIKLANEGKRGNDLSIIEKGLPVTKDRIFDDDTSMYRISRIIKGLQFTTKYNVVRLWNDSIAANASKENGKLIVSGIIYPDSITPALPEPKPKPIREPKPKLVRQVLSEEEKLKIRDDKYKDFVKQKTDGKIVVETYRGSKMKTDYRCAICGHQWSVRADHFKDRQEYMCPNCEKTKP